MNDYGRKQQLLNHAQVGSGPGGGQGGCCVALFGLPFLGAGLLVLAVAHGDITGAQKDVPDWVIGVFGSLFALAGLFMIGMGIRGWLATSQRKRLLDAHPDEPWREHDWDEREAHDRSVGPLGMFIAAAFLTLFMSIFNYAVFLDPKDPAPLFAKGIIVLFDLVALGVWLGAFYVLGRRLKYGRPRLRLSTFPFLLGQPLRVTLELPSTLSGFEAIKATLRCAEQVWETHGSGKNRSRRLVTYELWSEERSLAAEDVGRDATFSFDVPADAPPTELHGPVPRFWEVQLDAETPGIDYHGVFLMPVYALRKS